MPALAPGYIRESAKTEAVTLILIDSDAGLLRARALVDQLWNSNDPAEVARLEAHPLSTCLCGFESREIRESATPWDRSPVVPDPAFAFIRYEGDPLQQTIQILTCALQ